jgi:hypothetical protein
LFDCAEKSASLIVQATNSDVNIFLRRTSRRCAKRNPGAPIDGFHRVAVARNVRCRTVLDRSILKSRIMDRMITERMLRALQRGAVPRAVRYSRNGA